MLTVTLGTQSSGSTWLFNVVRALLADAGLAFFGGSTDDGMGLLDLAPNIAAAAVIKSHSLDQRFIRLAQLAGARLIVTTRDPRDSVVSQRERFGATVRWTVADLSKSLATLAVLPAGLPQLRLDYQDRFTERIDTVLEVARFLSLPVTAERATALFEALRPEAVRARVGPNPPGDAGGALACQDPIYMWHPNHVGDGRIGKWRDRLDAAEEATIADALEPLVRPDAWRREPIRWSPQLFQSELDGERRADLDLVCDGTGRCLVYGPFIYLPPGYWRVVSSVSSVNRLREVKIAADVYLAYRGEAPVVQASACLRAGAGAEFGMVFRHVDHFQPVEVRLYSVDGSRGRVRFEGCELRWLGPIEGG